MVDAQGRGQFPAKIPVRAAAGGAVGGGFLAAIADRYHQAQRGNGHRQPPGSAGAGPASARGARQQSGETLMGFYAIQLECMLATWGILALLVDAFKPFP